MKYRATVTAFATAIVLTACGGGSDDAVETTEPDPVDVETDDAESADAFAPATIDAAAVCAAIPTEELQALFSFAEFFSGEPSTLEGRSSCNYSASNGDASIVANASVTIVNEGGADGFAATVAKWEEIADVAATPGTGDDAVTVTESAGHTSMFVLDGDRVLEVRATTASSDKSIVDVFPDMADIATAAL